jgi:heptosyltransferase-1
VLIVKTSSMGDVVHALPAVSDMRRADPGLEVSWLVEAPFAAIPRLHPGVAHVVPIAWRKWRKTLWRAETRAAIATVRAELRRTPFDLVLDLQGLLKSVLWARQARGPLAGYDSASLREPAAAWFYRDRFAVPRDLQAVERCRRLAAASLGYALPDTPPDFGLASPPGQWQAPQPHAVLIPCASRPEKLWPEEDWIALGLRLRSAGLSPVVIWGSAEEHARAQRIASGCGGTVPPFLTVADTAAVLHQAQQVIGLDTGFSHLAAAFGQPTIGIYCDHEPGLAGITGSGSVASFGGKGLRPGRLQILAQLEHHLHLHLAGGTI